LGQAIGHLEGTAPPGSKSNIVLAGHITLAAGVYGPFAGLAQLAPGDVLFVYYGQERFQYVVDGHQMVDRTSIEVTYPSETGQVTLITCNNWDDAEGRYLERLVVTGHLVGG
jgi:LPXTG-site transpeptidase (sortase) family protein